MSLIVDGTTGVTFNDSSLQGAAASPYVLKNRIINGDMRIDQRNAGASVTPSNGAVTYTVDRFACYVNQASKLTAQQSTTAPTGFINSLKITSSSAYSVGSSDRFILQQYIEGLNIADLGWGTANAKTVTLSFQVYSSLTGTFGGSIKNNDGTRSYPFSYTISSANTWTSISVTIAGDTTGTWLTTNGAGIIVNFGLGTGSTFSGTAGAWASANYDSSTGATSVVGTNGATWYITGVQLEIGTSATPFERRLYNQELANCQRYYTLFNQIPGGATRVAGASPAAQGYMTATLPVQMRSAPTISLGTSGTSVASGYSYAWSNGASDHTLSTGNNLEIQAQNSTVDVLNFIMKSTSISWTVDRPLIMTSGKVFASAEL